MHLFNMVSSNDEFSQGNKRLKSRQSLYEFVASGTKKQSTKSN